MSNVLARKRGISEMEFYNNAREIRAELTRLLMNEKIVPKRWRPVFTYPTIDLIKQLFSCMVQANGIYPYKPEQVEERKRLQQYCIGYCEDIFDQLQYMIETLNYQEINTENQLHKRIEYVCNLLEREEILLAGWKKSTKLLTNTKKQ